jgi:hypothetical protein
MAMRRSFAALPNFSCAYAATKPVDARPNWSTAGLRPEHVFQMTVVEHGRGNTGGDPHELLGLIHPRRDRNALRRREEAEQDVDLLLIDQAHRFVDGDLGPALRIRIDRLDLIALDPALAIEIVDHDLGAERVQIRAAGRQRTAVVVDHPDFDLLSRYLRCSRCRAKQQQRGHHAARKTCTSPEGHSTLPE